MRGWSGGRQHQLTLATRRAGRAPARRERANGWERTRLALATHHPPEACPDRGDLFVVDDTVRDAADGSIIGFRALASLARPDALEAFLRLREERQADHIVRL